MNDQQETEWREEADRLARLDRETQRQIIALHRSVASNPKLGERVGP